MEKHRCPACDVSRSMQEIRASLAVLDDAVDAWLDRSVETSMGEEYAERRLDNIKELVSHMDSFTSAVDPHASPVEQYAYETISGYLKEILVGKFDGLPWGVSSEDGPSASAGPPTTMERGV